METFICPLLVLNPLLAHLYISYHITHLFRRNSVLLTGYHAAPVVTLFFSHAHVTCMALHHTVVIRYSPSVIYRTLYHASGHLVLYGECYGFERERFLLSHVFYLALLPAFSRLSWSWQFNFKVSRAPSWSSKHRPSLNFCLNHSNPQKIYIW